MKDEEKTNEQLIHEIKILRCQIAKFQKTQDKYKQLKKEFAKQKKLLKGAAMAKHCLLTVNDYNNALNRVLEILGCAVEVDAVGVFENHACDSTGEITFSQSYKWNRKSEGSLTADTRMQNIAYNRPEIKKLYDVISTGNCVCGVMRDFLKDEKEILEHHRIISLMIVPIHIGDKFWGFISFEDFHSERKWLESEKSILTTMAASIGGALERKYADEALSEREKRFRLLIENSSDAITILNSHGFISYMSPSTERVSGFSMSDLISTNIIEYIHHDDRQKVHNRIASVLKYPESSQTMELRIIDGNGVWHYIETTITNLLHEPGIEGIVANSHDISKQKYIQDALEAEKERLAVTLSSIGEGVITTDNKGKIVLINKVAEELTGWTQEEAVSKQLGYVFRIIDQKTRQVYKDPLKKLLKPRRMPVRECHTILVGKDGMERIISDTGALIRDKDNNVIGTVVVFRDITEKLMVEEELFKSGKIESISVLAGGVAHDFNNILTIILGNISLAIMHLKNGHRESTLERLSDIEKASLQAKDLTQQLLTLAKGGSTAMKTMSINGLLKDIVNFALCGSNILCKFSIPDELWNVEIDEGQISQVINNLIINAKQAMPDGGIIKVYAENMVVNSEHGLGLKVGRYVKIGIEDTGCGIPEEYLSKIFEPYFTTKPKGNGLGLAISYSIIKKHNGYITVRSKKDEGTHFSIYIPASDKIVIQNNVQEDLILNRGRILVMDDEKAVREIACMMLNQIGYEAYHASTGIEVIDLYVESMKKGQIFDVIIMDLTVPGGMGGKLTLQRLLKIDPGVKAVASSGYSFDNVMVNYGVFGFKGAITKPYTIEDLSKILHRVISEHEDISTCHA